MAPPEEELRTAVLRALGQDAFESAHLEGERVSPIRAFRQACFADGSGAMTRSS